MRKNLKVHHPVFQCLKAALYYQTRGLKLINENHDYVNCVTEDQAFLVN